MTLTLEVTQPQAASLGSASRKVFSTEGGTIGRANSSDWILSHRKVSGRHAVITCHEGTFYIVDDSSANGVFINSTKNRLIPGKRYALKSGDRIIIDPYEIDVSISAEPWADARRRFADVSDPSLSEYNTGHDPFDAADPFAPRDARTPRSLPFTPPAKPAPVGEVVPLEELDPIKLLDGKSKPAPRQPVRTSKDLENGSLLSGHYKPPAIPTPPPDVPPPTPAPAPPGAFQIPEDYNPLGPDELEEPGAEPRALVHAPTPAPFQIPGDYDPLRPDEPEEPGLEPRAAVHAPTPAPTPSPRPSPPPVPAMPPILATQSGHEPPRETTSPEPPPAIKSSSDPGLVAVLEGAGLERAPVTEEFARSFGQIFRVVVSGVMDVLRARQQIKDEFRMRLTQFRPADNNPLKFSANVDDALHNLLVKRNAAYLEPVEAFGDAFDDLRDHQIAMLAGMRVAFESMLNHFQPDQLQQHFDRQLKRNALSSMTARLHYWDLYRDRHEELTKDPEAAFRRLFGEEFARAYEEQLRRLKADRRAAAPPRSSDV